MSDGVRIGIDLGGTKIEAIALDASGTALGRERVPTPRGDYAGTLAAVASLVERFEADLGCRATVGVGVPGAVSRVTGLLKNANSTWLNGQRFPGDLAARLGREIRIANDANCFALSEAIDGAGASAAVVFGVILGTGTGGGLVVHGRVIDGPNGITGEWGHNGLPWPADDERPGPPCYCGLRGCIETFLSGPGLERDYAEGTGERLDARMIARRAGEGERLAVAVLERYADRLARALSTVINLLDPDVIVLGGGLSNIDTLYTEVPARWSGFVFSDRVDTPLRAAQHRDSSGVRGAAWLWPLPESRPSST